MATQSIPVGKAQRVPSTSGLRSWLTTVDHKRIGIMYAVASLFFFLVGGVEALLVRLELIGPHRDFLGPETYNQLFTMHGTTMVFLAVMPLAQAFMNYLLPLMIGARDVAFPRLNAFSFWVFILGGILLNSSWFLGGAPHGAWTGYAVLTTNQYSGINSDFWVAGLQLLGIGTLLSSINFIATILNMRAPGMKMTRMPVFAWTALVTSFLILLAFPAITVALTLLMFDRQFGTVFFDALNAGADVTLWQHLFWIFGHPEVYILILPAMGIISEVIPTFSRKPLFGYSVMVFSTAAIGFMGFSVWSHHMFTIGMGPIANTAFALTTMTIAIPTGVKIFNWIGTIWGGNVRFKTPMLFAVGFIAMFLIGGITGVMHSVVPSNYQQHDSYFIVAHFHYVLIGGAVFGLLAGFHYWFPKVYGRVMNETLGKWSFWLLFIGFNLTFFPMHFLGMMGMPRRYAYYQPDMGWELWNQVSTVGAFIMGFAILIFMHNLFASVRRGEKVGDDPWDARTIEWTLPTPVPHYNYAEIPKIHARDEFWARKYEGVKADDPVEGYDHDLAKWEKEHGIPMPNPSWWPLALAISLTIASYGLIYHHGVMAGGLVLTLISILGWVYEGTDGHLTQPVTPTAKGVSQ